MTRVLHLIAHVTKNGVSFPCSRVEEDFLFGGQTAQGDFGALVIDGATHRVCDIIFHRDPDHVEVLSGDDSWCLWIGKKDEAQVPLSH